jgi:hypothetical protein
MELRNSCESLQALPLIRSTNAIESAKADLVMGAGPATHTLPRWNHVQIIL